MVTLIQYSNVSIKRGDWDTDVYHEKHKKQMSIYKVKDETLQTSKLPHPADTWTLLDPDLSGFSFLSFKPPNLCYLDMAALTD